MIFLALIIGWLLGFVAGLLLGYWVMRDSRANRRAVAYRRLWKETTR